MAGNDYQVPDLASVLRTLAALAPNHQNVNVPPNPASQQLHQPVRQNDTLGVKPNPVPSQKSVDPSTIIDWSSGLRCVMKTVAAHDNILREIRRMIAVQHEHEAQWWQGRLALIQKQAGRKEGQKKLDEVLRAVGGAITSNEMKVSGLDVEAEELRTFDLKVYKAQKQMVEEMSTKLKSLGIPFFGTKTEMVRKSGKEPEPIEKGSTGPPKTISENELLELQRKMIGLLEEMCA